MPVDLGQAISGKVRVAVRAGRVQLAATSLTVTASFIDRLAIVATIVVVLVILLFVVRGRVRKYRMAMGQGEGDETGAHRAGRKEGRP